ncbi:MAG: sulfotransferase family 2 domain-containing protein [Pseudomonadota bacterium]
MGPIRSRLARINQKLGARRAAALCPQRVLFLHIPKTAGTTVNAYFKARLGSSWHGQAVTLTDEASPTLLALAAKARFIGGHFGARTLRGLGPGLRVTFLRDPLDRLISAWRFRQSMADPRRRLPFQRLEDALATDHPLVLTLFDNVQARQLAIAAEHDAALPLPRADWLDAALETLSSFAIVGHQESFEADFRRLLGRLDLPAPETIARRNVTAAREHRGEALAPLPDRAILERLAEPFIKIDRALLAAWDDRQQRERVTIGS